MQDDAPVPNVLVVTMLDVERDAILAAFGAENFTAGEHSGFAFHETQLVRRNGRCNLVILQTGDQGNTASSLATSCGLDRWHPALAFLLGIGGALDAEATLGSVVVVERVHYYELSKVHNARHLPDPRVSETTPRLVALAKGYGRSIDRPSNVRGAGSQRISLMFGGVLSGEKVVADANFKEVLRQTHARRALAVEMEAYGFCEAARRHGTEHMVLRGIADNATPEKDNTHQAVASRNAADVLQLILTQNLESLLPHQPPPSEVVPRLPPGVAERHPPTPKEVVVEVMPDRSEWPALLAKLNLVDSDWTAAEDESAEDLIILKKGTERRGFRCLLGTGKVLSKADVESSTLQIIYCGLTKLTLVTFGHLGDDGRRAYLGLKGRASEFEIVDGAAAATRLASAISEKGREFIQSLDAARDTLRILLDARRDVNLLISHETGPSRSYTLVLADGSVAQTDHPLVGWARRHVPDLVNATAQSGHTQFGAGLHNYSFAREEYLRKCGALFSRVEYPALAILGFRSPDDFLDCLYVEPDVSSPQDSINARLARYMDWASELPLGRLLTKPIRDAIEASIRPAGEGSDSGPAAATYQARDVVLLLGDPGSGKTCFVKREIVKYTRALPASWHGRHLPLYVALGKTTWSPQSDLLEAACRDAVRDGLAIDILTATSLATAGLISFFFDGVDEIVDLQRRAAICRAIRELARQYQPRGCRFTITSRPAAIENVLLPENANTLYIKGLDESRQRELAMRLAGLHGETKVEEGPSGTPAHNGSPWAQAMVERLLKDAHEVKGIGQLAANPLFLTFLVQLYVNSGPPGARRHKVYPAAIRTLIAVRAHSAQRVVLSEAELRARLGAVALRWLVGNWVPTRSAVCRVIQEVMKTTDDDHNATYEQADEYLTNIATVSGLLQLNHAVGDDPSTAIVTFLHYSFLEYYAAQAIKARASDDTLISGLVRDSRWREPLMILAGMLGAESDATPLIRLILTTPDIEASASVDSLSLALDCAAEVDGLTEAAVRLLLISVDQLVGPRGVADSETRARIGLKLGRLWALGGYPLVTQHFIAGMQSADLEICASRILLLGYCADQEDGELLPEVLEAFDAATRHRDPRVLEAVAAAVGESRQLRTAQAQEALVAALDASRPPSLRLAAAQAFARAPVMTTSGAGNPLLQAMRSDAGELAAYCARALLSSGWKFADEEQLLKALVAAQSISDSLSTFSAEVPVIEALVERGMVSHAPSERLLGIRLLPWDSRDDAWRTSLLLSVLRDGKSTADERAAALDAIRFSSTLHRHMGRDEIGEVISWAKARRDESDVQLHVRGAAIRALSALVTDSTGGQIAQGLMEILDLPGSPPEEREMRLAYQGLERCIAKSQRTREWAMKRLRGKVAKKFDRRALAEMTALLRVLAFANAGPKGEAVGPLVQAIDDHRYTSEMRSAAMFAYGVLAPLGADAVRRVTNWLRATDGLWVPSAGWAAAHLTDRITRQLDQAGDSLGELEPLASALSEYLHRYKSVRTFGEAQRAMLRQAISSLGVARQMLGPVVQAQREGSTL